MRVGATMAIGKGTGSDQTEPLPANAGRTMIGRPGAAL
jgi:hypothetical protein